MNKRSLTFLLTAALIVVSGVILIPVITGGRNEEAVQVRIPILMFHAFTADESEISYMTVTQDQFRAHLQTMLDAGFNPITFTQLINFVNGGDLPQNPFIVTIDDGYLCNFELAFPVLLDLNVPATIGLIGSRRGEYTYMGRPSLPHFTWAQATEMHKSGLVDFANHSWAMHGAPGVTIGRVGMVMLEGEYVGDFIYAIEQDLKIQHEYFRFYFGDRPYVFVYPFGIGCQTVEQVLLNSGYRATIGTVSGVSAVKRYAPETLINLNRINVSGYMADSCLLYRVAGFLWETN
ncbi:MAG: polysaccharide deacetylase family protein [Defluviitaleaceae bacterium]|nr:polysaccharide deacetylase family protein [Defluviitaleaceae bacterium]